MSGGNLKPDGENIFYSYQVFAQLAHELVPNSMIDRYVSSMSANMDKYVQLVECLEYLSEYLAGYDIDSDVIEAGMVYQMFQDLLEGCSITEIQERYQ